MPAAVRPEISDRSTEEHMSASKAVLGSIMLVGLLCGSSLCAQSLPPDFKKAQEERSAAMSHGDAKVYGRYTIDDFVVVMPNGSMQTRSDRMAAMSKAATPEQLGPPRDEKATVAGDTIILNWISAIQGKDARFTEVWVKIGRRWKVAGAHVSMIQKKP
jgi:ketosteroid isomerase-like protein